jgi:hypothetical protein
MPDELNKKAGRETCLQEQLFPIKAGENVRLQYSAKNV